MKNRYKTKNKKKSISLPYDGFIFVLPTVMYVFVKIKHAKHLAQCQTNSSSNFGNDKAG